MKSEKRDRICQNRYLQQLKATPDETCGNVLESRYMKLSIEQSL